VLLSAIAFVNEHFTKEALGIPRPSHLFIVQNSLSSIKIDSLYQLTETERKKTLRLLIDSDSVHFGKIDTRILNHWIEEAGYSFPSGHSFNAFMLATILAFSLYHSRSSVVRLCYLFPFFWALLVAISRVSVGAHSVLDVSFGAALGLIFGNLFLFVDYTRSIITERE
jgi:phosphatidylglycerophosphatase B